MKKVVLISYHYPPSEAVGGLRAEKVVAAFRAADHEVHVITARLPRESAVVRHQEPGLVIETVEPWTSPRWWYINFKRRIARSRKDRPSPEGANVDPNPTEPAAQVPRWKRWISALLWLPDDKQGFIPPAVRAGLRAYRAGGNVLYTTVPPFSTHLAGLLLQFLSGMRWVLEFRDPWSDSHFRAPHQRSRWTSAIERWLERRCLNRADLVVSVSEGIQRALLAKVPPAASEKFLVVRNGITRLASARNPAADRRPFRIVHVGSLYHRRDPFPFLEGLSRFMQRHGLDAQDVIVEFVGNCEEYQGTSVGTRAQDLGLGKVLAIHGWVSHGEAQQLITEANLLLLLAQDQPAQIPNKLYDYLGSRVPILAFVDDQGESAWMLRKVGGHHLVTNNAADWAEAVMPSAMAPISAGAAERADLLAEWTTERQMAILVAAVELSREGVVDGQSGSVAARAAV